MLNESEFISKSLFAEATQQMRRIFSSTSIKSLELECQKNPEEKSLTTIFYQFLKNFCKIYSLRIAFMSLSLLGKKDLFSNLMNYIFNIIFNRKNFNTAIFVSLVPTIYNLLHKLFNNIIDINSPLFTFVSGVISGFIAIKFEDKTELVKFMILSVLSRIIHSFIYLLAMKNNINPNNTLYSYIGFTIICTIFNFFIYFVPGFKPIQTLANKYTLPTKEDIVELLYYKQKLNLFPEDKVEWVKD